METVLNILFPLVTYDANYGRGSARSELLGLSNSDGQILLDTLLIIVPVAIIMAAIYYLLLNRTFKLDSFWIWLSVLVLVGAIAFQAAFRSLTNYIFVDFEPLNSLGWKFVGHSVLLAAVIFYLSSLLFKRWSTNAKYTPH